MTAHPIPAAALKESVAVVGRTGSGKTFAAKGAVELLLADGARVCIVDPTGVWYGLRSSPDGKEPRFPVVVFGGTHGDVAIGDASGAALGELLATRNLPAIIDVSEFTRAGMVRFMGPFLDALYRHNRTPLTLVVDEADIFAPQRPEPDTATMLGRMEQIVRRGRVRGFRPWLITQRPASLNKNVLSQANTLIAMQLTAPQDRDAIGAWIEGQADRDEGRKVLAALPKLQKGEGYVWSPSHNILERVRFPAITTFDSGRTPEDGETEQLVELAAIDLTDIRDNFLTIEKKAAENDPKALRAEIAHLKRTRELSIEPDALREARRLGKIDGYSAAISALQPMVDRMQTLRIALDEQLGDLIDDLGKWRARHEEPIGRSEQALKKDEGRVAAVPNPASGQQQRREVRSFQSASGIALSKAERLILTVLAQYPDGRTKVQVAILTGYAVGGGGFSNAISALRTKGCLDGDAARLVITPGGIAAIGDYDPLPHGRALLDHWLKRIGKAERKALESLAEVYPRTLSKSQLATRAGYEVNGGGWNNALSRLRTLELISGKAELKASDALFG